VTLEEGENEDDKWITVMGNGKTKKLLTPKLAPILQNAFAILSQSNAPIIYTMSGPALIMDDNKTIIPPDPLVSTSFLSFRYAFVIPFCLFLTMCISVTIKY
jgi:hypothetical protein